MLLASIGTVFVAAVTGTVLLLIRKRGVTGRWFEDSIVNSLAPCSSDWVADNRRDRGKHGE